MLQNIRDRATGPLAWFIVGIICVPFAFFGIEAFRSGGGKDVAAVVGDEDIGNAQLRQQYDAQYQRLQQMLGENFRPDMIDPDTLRANVLNGLVDQSVLRQYLQDDGYRVSDDVVLEFISRQSQFQEDGRFSPERYREVLARQGQSAVRYEDRVREYLSSTQLQRAIADSHFVVPAEVEQRYRVIEQSRSFQVRRHQLAAAADAIEISDADIASYYDEHQAEFMTPERIKLDYVMLSLGAIKDGIAATPEELQALYESEKATRFTDPEQRKARHILIRSGDDADAAKPAIEAIAAELAAGADFAELAKTKSQDPGSAGRGGELGWVSRGQMVPEFETVLFDLETGAVSEPFESSFGWHIVKLDELRPQTVRPFDDEQVQRDLLALYQDREARDLFQERAETLDLLSFENPGSLAPVAEALGLEIQQTDWFTRQGGEGIAAEDAVVAAAFSELVLQDQENSRPLTLGTDQAVVRLAEHEAPRQQSLDEVRDQVVAAVREERAQDAVIAAAEAELAALNSGETTFADLPDSETVEVSSYDGVKRDGEPRELVGAVFEEPRPAPGGEYHFTLTLANGDVAVVSMTGVTDGDWASASDAEKQRVRQQLETAQGGADVAAMQQSLRDATKVKIVRDSF